MALGEQRTGTSAIGARTPPRAAISRTGLIHYAPTNLRAMASVRRVPRREVSGWVSGSTGQARSSGRGVQLQPRQRRQPPQPPQPLQPRQPSPAASSTPGRASQQDLTGSQVVAVLTVVVLHVAAEHTRQPRQRYHTHKWLCGRTPQHRRRQARVDAGITRWKQRKRVGGDIDKQVNR